jgi:hypothetical protein
MSNSTHLSDRVRSRYANLDDATRCNPCRTVPAWCALGHTRTANTFEYKEIFFLIKAARFYGPGDIRLDDIPEPKRVRGRSRSRPSGAASAGPTCTGTSRGRSLLRLQTFRTRSPARAVPTLGHEFAGRVH